MRLQLIAAASALALAAVAGGAVAQDAAPGAAAAAAPAGAVTDVQLEGFAKAMGKIRTISAAVQGGTPTAEQQAAMAAAIQEGGLDIATFNAISTQVSSDPVMRARVAVAAAAEPAAGSVAAGVSDAEIEKFSTAMAHLRDVAPAGGAAPTAEQQASMAQIVETSGLGVERFNAISTAVSADAHLRARVELADARRDAGE